MCTRGGNSSKSILSTLPTELPLDFLETITDQFSEKLIMYTEAFGTVYKGTLPDGEIIVVKKLSENAPVPRDKAFANEIASIMPLTHKNIVKLVGFCLEGQKKVVLNNGRYIVADVFESLICYEYLPRGNLRENLLGTAVDIDWSTRFKIIKGICEGLDFIHSIPIIHMDLKPENIWLDNNMEAKIANFGLSRLFGEEQTREVTKTVVGSYGYIAPEYLYLGEISTKSDIYSLGILMLEITTGDKNLLGEEPSPLQYIRRIREEWTAQRIQSMYSSLYGEDLQQVHACIQIGLKCVEIDRQKRPSAQEILGKLSNRGKEDGV